MKMNIVDILVLLLMQFNNCLLRICEESDLHYEVTECDKTNSRWTFQVPHANNSCELSCSSLPRRINNCDMMCPSGQYMNSQIKGCEICPPGTYSKGDKFEITEWENIPEGLNVDVTHNADVTDGCNQSGWFPKRDYLLGKTTIGCAIMLSMKTKNLKPGKVEFTYQIDEYTAMGYFTIRNDRCAQLPGSGYLLQRTGSYAYASVQLDVPAGHNVLQWYLFTENEYMIRYYGFKDPEIIIKSILVTGGPPVTTCNPCTPGSFSASSGSDHCDLCPLNSYSLDKATTCIPCTEDNYAPRGSGACISRSPCTKNDYMSYWTPCDVNGKTQKKWKWIEPKICDDKTGEKLPEPENLIDCLSCPMGTFVKDSLNCFQCPVGKISDSKNPQLCAECSSENIPYYGLLYKTWSRMPPLLNIQCPSYLESDCPFWKLDRDFLSGGIGMGLDQVARVELPIKYGFISMAQDFETYSPFAYVQPPIPNTYIRIEFELICSGKCRFAIKQDLNGEGREYTVSSWEQSLERTNFTYYIRDSDPTKFSWMFEKLHTTIPVSLQDHVRIYQIEVTNAAKFSAIGCQTCVKGIKNGVCNSCPPGLYYAVEYDEKNKTSIINCTVCPSNTILVADSSSYHTVNEACHECEPGTIATNNLICLTDTEPTFSPGYKYNLTELMKGIHKVNSPKMFTPSGVPYFHEFRINLAYGKTVRCIENSSGIELSGVTAMICRHTNIPTSSYRPKPAFSKPLSLADRLIKALPSNSSNKFWKEINENLTKAGWSKDEVGTDLHYIFASDVQAPNCPNGRTSVVTLRCSLAQKSDVIISSTKDTEQYFVGNLELPPLCPDGTCDGCTYHFMWITVYACRLCTTRDFIRIAGECTYGQRTIHLISALDCVIPKGMNLTEIERCPLLTTTQLTAIILTFIILIILASIIFVCHRRNKRLEYKYMKLVQSTSGKHQVTSCALEENEVDNVDQFGRRIAPTEKYDNSTGIVLEPKHFMNSSMTKQYEFKGFPKINLPPIIYKTKGDQDRVVLTEQEDKS